MYKAVMTNTSVLIMIERTSQPSIVWTCRDELNVDFTKGDVRSLIKIFLTVARENIDRFLLIWTKKIALLQAIFLYLVYICS